MNGGIAEEHYLKQGCSILFGQIFINIVTLISDTLKEEDLR